MTSIDYAIGTITSHACKDHFKHVFLVIMGLQSKPPFWIDRSIEGAPHSKLIQYPGCIRDAQATAKCCMSFCTVFLLDAQP